MSLALLPDLTSFSSITFSFRKKLHSIQSHQQRVFLPSLRFGRFSEQGAVLLFKLNKKNPSLTTVTRNIVFLECQLLLGANYPACVIRTLNGNLFKRLLSPGTLGPLVSGRLSSFLAFAACSLKKITISRGSLTQVRGKYCDHSDFSRSDSKETR